MFMDASSKYDTQYYAQSVNIEEAQNITVTVGQTQTVNVALAQSSPVMGTVKDATGKAMKNVVPQLFQKMKFPLPGKQWQAVKLAVPSLTNKNGQYQLKVVSGTYRVGFATNWDNAPFAYYSCAKSGTKCTYAGKSTLDQADDVVVVAGKSTLNINLTIAPPPAPKADVVSSENVNILVDILTGKLIISVSPKGTGPMTITKVVTCASGTVPKSVTLNVGAMAYPMVATPAGSTSFVGVLPATFTDLLVQGQPQDLKVVKTCTARQVDLPEDEFIGTVAIDTSKGHITDKTTGKAIEGAKVTLYTIPGWDAKQSKNDTGTYTCQSNLSKESGAPWSQKAETELSITAWPDSGYTTPAVNPILTNEQGNYGWTTIAAGCYYITTEADGYVDGLSFMVGLPPTVTDLDLALTPKPMLGFEQMMYTVNETEGQATITVTLNLPQTQDVTIHYVTAGGDATLNKDYTPISGTLTFKAGELVKTFTVAVLKDQELEQTEQVALTLENEVGAELSSTRAEAVLGIEDGGSSLGQVYLPLILKAK